jgi:hypothetical protein
MRRTGDGTAHAGGTGQTNAIRTERRGLKNMSAFVVGTETMDRVVAVICGQSRWGYVLRTFAGTAIPNNPEAMTEIGRKLYAMNVEAVSQRYPDCEARHDGAFPGPKGARKLPTKYKFAGESPLSGRGCGGESVGGMDWIRHYKAMTCLQYQCSEGNIAEVEPYASLYAELSTACGRIAEHILARTPEYDAAPWD